MQRITMAAFAAALLVLAPGAVLAQKTAKDAGDLVWTELTHLEVEGRGFGETLSFYDRLPARAQKKVRDDVWRLSRHSAGLAVRFVTDATTISARWTLTSPKLEMVHMPATGVSGLDLYARDDAGAWRWLGVGRPTGQETTAELAKGLTPGKREYFLYLPLYNGVSKVALGVPRGHTIAPAPAYPAGRDKPIVFYGTSITQGGCASRPGMVHTALLGRWLGYPVINLGFSGNGRMELEVGEFMADIDASVYVIDCLPNLNAGDVAKRTEPLVHQLRKARPSTPILLVEDRTYSNSLFLPSRKETNTTNRAALRAAYEKLQQEGVTGLYYLHGEKMLGTDNEGTVDSSHPTDLGFWRQAEAFLPALKKILK